MNRTSKAITSLCIAVLTAWAAPLVHAQNLVVDPGFEASADGTGAHPFVAPWVVSDLSGNPPGTPGSNSNVGGDAASRTPAINYANLGAQVVMGQTFGTLSQTLATVAGQSYTVSFWLANNSTVPVSTFSAFFGTSLVYSTTGAAFGMSGAYTFITGSFIATGASTTLRFEYRHDDDFWRLDDVSVTAPEGGASLWLILPVFAGLFLLNGKVTRARSASRS